MASTQKDALESNALNGTMAGPSIASTEPIRLAIIAALTRTNGIGANGTLPWSLPKEMTHFRKATQAVGEQSGSHGDSANAVRNAVIMGRKTWQSIPTKFRPLTGRINVVVSRQTGEEAESNLGIKDAQDTHLVNSLDSAVALLSTIPIRSRLSRTYLIGGAQLYEQALRRAPQGAILDRMLITRIYEPAYKECDVFLPEFRTPGQVKEENEAHGNADEVTPQPIIADQTTSPWIRASTQDFDQFMGTPVTRGVIEEKGSKYTLQMWTRRNT